MLALGASGGPRIITAVTQVILKRDRVWPTTGQGPSPRSAFITSGSRMRSTLTIPPPEQLVTALKNDNQNISDKRKRARGPGAPVARRRYVGRCKRPAQGRPPRWGCLEEGSGFRVQGSGFGIVAAKLFCGGTLLLWQKLNNLSKGASMTEMPYPAAGTFCWTELMTRDVAAAKEVLW